MERVIELLEEKNHFLEEFFCVNERELISFEKGEFDNIESFYQAREKVLEVIRCIEGLIHEENERSAGREINGTDRQEVEVLLKAKGGWVAAILAQDLRILSCIEKEKSNIIRELRATSSAKKAVSAYRGIEAPSPQLDDKV